jgi:hypothetical protein
MADTFVLMTVESPGLVPDLARAAEILGVDKGAMDSAFGVVPIDPDNGRYAVQVRSTALGAAPKPGDAFSGPFSNPRIEPYGPKKP